MDNANIMSIPIPSKDFVNESQNLTPKETET